MAKQHEMKKRKRGKAMLLAELPIPIYMSRTI